MSMMKPVSRIDAQPALNVPEYNAQKLTQDGSLAKIMLDEKCYYLRITRQGKLILTK